MVGSPASSQSVSSFQDPQVEIVDPELYMYDGEVLAKAAEMGKPGLIDICQRQVGVHGPSQRLVPGRDAQQSPSEAAAGLCGEPGYSSTHT